MARRAGYRLKARFATVGYKRDVEKKYVDNATTEDSKELKYKSKGCVRQKIQAAHQAGGKIC